MTEDKVKKAAQDLVKAWANWGDGMTLGKVKEHILGRALTASLTPSREEQADWLESEFEEGYDNHPMFNHILAELRKGESK